MKSNNLKSVFAILLLSLTFTGCFGVDRSFKGMRNFLMLSSGDNFEKEFEFSLGSVTLSVAEIALNFSDVDDEIGEVLSEISSVQIGVYNNNSDVVISPSNNELNFLTGKMKKAGWDCIVKSKSYNEIAAVFVKINDDELNQLYVVSVDNDEMVIVQILGNLNKAIEYAISEKGIDFAMNH